MALDPIAAALLEQFAAAEAPPMNEQTPAEAREMSKGFLPLAGPGEEVAEVSDRTIPGPAGDLPVRIYTPVGAPEGPLPAVLYFHGGGWVIGDLDTLDPTARALANRSGAKVVSVDYRLCPECTFPAPVDDCFAATQWVADHGEEIGVDPQRLAVAGDSAGGTLAAAVALRARAEGGPALRAQALVYPVTDHSFDTPSYRENGDGYLLTRDTMIWFWDHYLADESDGDDPLASPLRAPDVSDLPPALVITAEYDPLRDEGEAYAARMAEAGVPVTTSRYDGQIHGFFQMPGTFPTAHTAIEEVAGHLRAAFGTA